VIEVIAKRIISVAHRKAAFFSGVNLGAFFINAHIVAGTNTAQNTARLGPEEGSVIPKNVIRPVLPSKRASGPSNQDFHQHLNAS